MYVVKNVVFNHSLNNNIYIYVSLVVTTYIFMCRWL